MGEEEMLRWIMGKAEAAPLLVLVVWAELRFLPLVLDAIGWNRAIGAKLGVTEAEAQAQRPAGLLTRLFRRPPNGGPPPAAVIGALMLALVLGGCVSDADRALLDRGVSHNMGVAGDETAPPLAREVALDNADAFALLRYSLTGDELPPETRARLEEHRAAVEGTAPVESAR